jgi:DNA segregation ATPase FtsK/SpoIIIE, S-DNA-T family
VNSRRLGQHPGQHPPPLPGTVIAGWAGGLWLAVVTWGWQAVAVMVVAGGLLLWRRPVLRGRVTAGLIATARLAATVFGGGRARWPAPPATDAAAAPVTPSDSIAGSAAASTQAASGTVNSPLRTTAPQNGLASPDLAADADEPDDTDPHRDAINDVFTTFGIDARVAACVRGPSVTRYEVTIGPGVKISRVTQLIPNIEYATGSPQIRVVSPIPGRSAIGIELPNSERETVTLPEALAQVSADAHPLHVVLGKDITGGYVAANLGRLPHLLIAGATGSGKSGAVNSLLCTLLTRATPEQVRLLLIDPKRVELTAYAGVPHLATPIVTDPGDAVAALEWAITEMDCRYSDIAAAGARNIDAYNRACTTATLTTPDGRVLTPYPYLVVVVDELADLMLTAKVRTEAAIVRLTQLARAAGIHMALATQRPSVDVVTGLIKANVPARLAFAVTSGVDSRTILDTGGAEKLLGAGDALWAPADALTPLRLQGVWADDTDIAAAVTAAKAHTLPAPLAPTSPSQTSEAPASDDLLRHAVELVVVAQLASASMLQRKLRIGYARAGHLLDQLETCGIIGPAPGPNKPRPVLYNDLATALGCLDGNRETLQKDAT